MDFTLSGFARPVARPGQALFAAAVLMLVLNLVDGILTLAVVYSGTGVEANPLMSLPLTSMGPVSFMIIKMTLVSLGVLMLWRLRERKLAVGALMGVTAAYSALFIYHFQSVDAVARYIVESSPGLFI